MKSLIPLVEDFVTRLLSTKLSNDYFYHNISHTATVVKCATDFSIQKGLNPDDSEIVIIAS